MFNAEDGNGDFWLIVWFFLSFKTLVLFVKNKVLLARRWSSTSIIVLSPLIIIFLLWILGVLIGLSSSSCEFSPKFEFLQICLPNTHTHRHTSRSVATAHRKVYTRKMRLLGKSALLSSCLYYQQFSLWWACYELCDPELHFRPSQWSEAIWLHCWFKRWYSFQTWH